jgi:hypothetical protein
LDWTGFTHPDEARQILAEQIEELRVLGYDELKRQCGTVTHRLFGGRFEILEGGDPPREVHVTGRSGVAYFLQIDIEDPFGPVEVSVNIGERFGNAPEVGDGFEIWPPNAS